MYQILVDGELFCDSRVQDLAVIDPVVTLEANSAGTLIFTVPPAHPYYNAIKRRTSIITVLRDEEEIFEGFCVLDSTDFFKQKRVECEGSLSFLNDSVLRPQRYQGLTVRQLLESYINQHNAQTENFKHFSVGIVTVDDPNDFVSCYTNYDTTLKSIKDDLVEDLGGYIRVRNENGNRYIDYIAETPKTATQPIKLGENLIDFESNLDSTEIATVIIPLGASLESEGDAGLNNRATIKSVNGGLDYIQNDEAVQKLGRIEQAVIWEDIATPSILLTKAQRYLSETQFENVIITAKAIDLHYADQSFDQFHILDNVRVISKLHGLDKYFVMTQQTINLNSPEEDELILGSVTKLTLSAQSAQSNQEVMKKIENIPQTSSILEAARQNATELITASNTGYITTTFDNSGHPRELYITDSKNIDDAVKVWRWSIGGLGYSSNGKQGPYYTAITMDGKIVADFITTGRMSADRIYGGKLTLGGYNDSIGKLEVKDAKGNVLVTLDNRGITLDDSVRISANTIKGGTITLGGSDMNPANLVLLDGEDNVCGTWDEDGIDMRSNDWIPSTFEKNTNFSLSLTNLGLNPRIENLTAYFVNLPEEKNFSIKLYFQVIGNYYNQVQKYYYARNEYINSWDLEKVNEFPEESSIVFGQSIAGYRSADFKNIYMVRLDELINRYTLGLSGTTDVEFSIFVSVAGYQIDNAHHAVVSTTPPIEREDGERYEMAMISAYDSIAKKMLYKWNGRKTLTKGVRFDFSKKLLNFENIFVDSNHITVYPDGDIVGVENDMLEFEIGTNKMKHKAVYNNTVSGSAVYVDSNGNLGRSSSSARYKHDIAAPNDFDCDKLYDLPVVQYRYNADHWDGVNESPLQLGFIAEDVAKHFPHAAVFEGENVETWEVRPLIPAMLKLIQEQNERIKKLEEVLDNGKC